MNCPNCGKTYYSNSTVCPYCGNVVVVRSGAQRGAAQNNTQNNAQNRRPAVAHPPRNATRDSAVKGSARSANPEVARTAPTRNGNAAYSNRPADIDFKKRSGKSSKRRSSSGLVIAWIIVAAIIVTFVALYFTGVFKSKDRSELGVEYITQILSGNTEKAFEMMPFDVKKIHADNWRAELRDDFGGDFEKFSEQYKIMGVSAANIDEFAETVFNKLTSDLKLGMISVSGGKCDIKVEPKEERVFESNEVAAYREELRASFNSMRVPLDSYFDVRGISEVHKASYSVSMSENGYEQTGEYSLYLVGVDGKWYVVPLGGAVSAEKGSIAGSWSFEKDGNTVAVTFENDGTGSMTLGESSVPLTYELIGSDAARITCAALNGGDPAVCTYKSTSESLTLTFSDGTLGLKPAV